MIFNCKDISKHTKEYNIALNILQLYKYHLKATDKQRKTLDEFGLKDDMVNNLIKLANQ